MRDFLQNCCRKRIFFRYLQSERRQEVFPGRNSSAVEHFTRNEGVPSSNLGFGSKSGGCIAGCDLFFVCGRRRGRDAPHLPPAERRLRDTDAPHSERTVRPHPHPNRDLKGRQARRQRVSHLRPVSAGRVRNVIVFLYLPLSTSKSSTVRPLSVTKRRIRIGGLKPKCRPGPESGPFCRTNAVGRQPGTGNPRNGRPEAYCCMADNKPTNLQKIRPPGCGDSGGVGRGPGPTGVRAAPPESRRLPRRQTAVGRMCRGIRCAEVQNGCAPCPSYDLPQAEDLTGRRKEMISPF